MLNKIIKLRTLEHVIDSERRNKLLLEIASMLPSDLDTVDDDRNKVLVAPEGNDQEYTIDNCEKFGIAFLSRFVDIDTYICERRGMRIQGYFPIKHESDLALLNTQQLELLKKMIEEGDIVKGRTLDGQYDDSVSIRVGSLFIDYPEEY